MIFSLLQSTFNLRCQFQENLLQLTHIITLRLCHALHGYVDHCVIHNLLVALLTLVSTEISIQSLIDKHSGLTVRLLLFCRYIHAYIRVVYM